jgi:hypothetical protein
MARAPRYFVREQDIAGYHMGIRYWIKYRLF